VPQRVGFGWRFCAFTNHFDTYLYILITDAPAEMTSITSCIVRCAVMRRRLAGGCSRHCGWASAAPASTSTPSTWCCWTWWRSTPSATATPTTGRRGWSPARRTRRTPPDDSSTGTPTRRCPAASCSPRSRCPSRNSSWPTTTSTRADTFVYRSVPARTVISSHRMHAAGGCELYRYVCT